MTFEEIDQLTIETAFGELIERILDVSDVPDGEPIYMLDQDDTKTFFERVIVHQNLVKPALAIFEAELQEYKNELNAIEQARLDEIARVEDIKSRFSGINPAALRYGLDKSGKKISNPALELRRIVSENDQPFLAELEGYAADYATEKAQKDAEMQAEAMAEGLVNLCLGCVKIVMKHNVANGLTKEQKDQQAVDYADAFNALKDWRPGKFKSAVVAMTPDGVLVKQELKDELSNFLAFNGL